MFTHTKSSIAKPRVHPKLALIASSILYGAASTSAIGSELVDFYSTSSPYFYPTFLSADGVTSVGYLVNNGGIDQVARLNGGGLEVLSSLGGMGTFAKAISSDGNVIVGNSQTSGGATHAFRWQNGVITDLGTLGGSYSNALAVSADGAVVAGYAIALNNHDQAFRWENGISQNLGTLGGLEASARAISADGTVIAGIASIANGDQHAFRWTSNGMADLGTLGGSYSYAVAANADGSVVIGDSLLADNGSTHVFRWSTATGMTDIGTLGGYYSVAQFVSADGNVVVGRSILADNVTTRVFRWSNGTQSDLGSLGGNAVYANAMNSSGTIIVGRALDTSNHYQAYRWTSSLGLQTVANWLADNGVVVNTSSANPDNATGVSADGKVVIGQLSNGHGYLARIIATPVITPPVTTPQPPVTTPPPTVTTPPVVVTPAPGPSSGLIDLDEYTAGLMATRVQASTLVMNNNDLTLNGLHGNPMRHRLEAGKQSVWASGDLGRSDHDAYEGNSAVGEVGYGIGVADGVQFNLALGNAWSRQDGSWGGKTTVRGTYLLPEMILRVPSTSVYASLSGLYNDGHSNVDRGYSNAGVQNGSHGSTSIDSLGGRLRLDWLDAFMVDDTHFTPYISHTYLQTKTAGYTESSGSFPVAWAGGIEAALGVGVASVMLNATTEGGNPSYWANAGYEIKF